MKKLTFIIFATLPNFISISMAMGLAAIYFGVPSESWITAVIYGISLIVAGGLAILFARFRRPRRWMVASWLLLLIAMPSFELGLSKVKAARHAVDSSDEK